MPDGGGPVPLVAAVVEVDAKTRRRNARQRLAGVSELGPHEVASQLEADVVRLVREQVDTRAQLGTVELGVGLREAELG